MSLTTEPFSSSRIHPPQLPRVRVPAKLGWDGIASVLRPRLQVDPLRPQISSPPPTNSHARPLSSHLNLDLGLNLRPKRRTVVDTPGTTHRIGTTRNRRRGPPVSFRTDNPGRTPTPLVSYSSAHGSRGPVVGTPIHPDLPTRGAKSVLVRGTSRQVQVNGCRKDRVVADIQRY